MPHHGMRARPGLWQGRSSGPESAAYQTKNGGKLGFPPWQ
jgi:hypothetical protein